MTLKKSGSTENELTIKNIFTKVVYRIKRGYALKIIGQLGWLLACIILCSIILLSIVFWMSSDFASDKKCCKKETLKKPLSSKSYHQFYVDIESTDPNASRTNPTGNAILPNKRVYN